MQLSRPSAGLEADAVGVAFVKVTTGSFLMGVNWAALIAERVIIFRWVDGDPFLGGDEVSMSMTSEPSESDSESAVDVAGGGGTFTAEDTDAGGIDRVGEVGCETSTPNVSRWSRSLGCEENGSFGEL